MHRTFNMGIGMVLVVANHRAMDVVAKLRECGDESGMFIKASGAPLKRGSAFGRRKI